MRNGLKIHVNLLTLYLYIIVNMMGIQKISVNNIDIFGNVASLIIVNETAYMLNTYILYI